VGIQTEVASNGLEGYNIVKERADNGKKPFDLIFMDIHMPVMDGLEAATKIAELGIETPIVALTANIMSNDLDLYKTSGMLDYLGKPFTSQELWKCLIKYFEVLNVTAVDNTEQNIEDEKSLKLLRRYFIKSNQNIIDKLKQTLDDGDLKQAHRIAHSLKSNAAQIGEKKLRELAAETESILSDVKHKPSEKQLRTLESELSIVLEKLTQLLEHEEDETVAAEPADMEKSLMILNVLEKKLHKRMPDSMNMLDDIRTIPGSEELAHYVEEMEFKDAIEELEKLKTIQCLATRATESSLDEKTNNK